MALTSIGRVFLQLPGKDAVCWLLTNEAVQSMGENDPWRAPRVLFEWLKDSVIGTAYHEKTVERLVNLGVLVPYDDEIGHVLREEMRDVAEAVAVEGPWHLAIRAMIAEERALAIPGLLANAIEQNIAHVQPSVLDVHNALLPIFRDLTILRRASLSPAVRQWLDNMHDRVVQVLDFVDSIAHLSDIAINEEPSSFTPSELLADILRRVDPEHRVQWNPPMGSWQLHAPRTLLTCALSYVVINALRATTTEQPVRVAATRTRDSVRIAVDDGGPIVRMRNRLFGNTAAGADRDAGFGLSLAWHVVAGTLCGRIWCERSDLGGARLVIELPQPATP